jgi:hypothetical protein
MGELLDALNAVETGRLPPRHRKSTLEQVTETFQSASRQVEEAVEAARQPDMPLDILARLVRQAPLQSLAVAFMAGVMVSRRR